MTIGQITKPHGVRGEVRVTPLTDDPKRFEWLDSVFVGTVHPIKIRIAGVRYHQELILLKFEGYPDRDSVEQFRDQLLQVPEDEAVPLADGEYFLYQAIGLKVQTEEGTLLGNVREILETGANNVFVVAGAKGELLIPDIPDVICTVDIEHGRIVIRPMPGLLD